MKVKWKIIKKILGNIKIIIIGIFISIGYWMIEALLHSLYFDSGSNYFQFLFTNDLHELQLRITAVGFVLGLSIFIQIINIKRSRIYIQLEESIKFLQNLFDAIQDGISVLDRDLNIIKINSWMEKMYGSRESLSGKKCYNVYQQRSSSCPWCPSIKTIETGKMHDEVVPYPSEKEPVGWIQLTAFPIYDENNNVINIIEYVKNITKQVEFQKKLQASEHQFRKAFNRAEFYKDLFAHDMSNILQHLLSSMELCILYQKKPENPKKTVEIINIAKEQVMRGIRLVDNVRMLSKIEDSEIKTHPVEIYKLIEDAIIYLKNAYQERDIDIQLISSFNEVEIQANGLLNDIFENILNNAVQHNDQLKIKITIKLSEVHKGAENYLKIEFKDNGVGIKDEWKEIIFKRGFMEGRSIKGMGLGLSLVKKIVENYHGHIWAEDNVRGDSSKGSNIVLLIPMEGGTYHEY